MASSHYPYGTSPYTQASTPTTRRVYGRSPGGSPENYPSRPSDAARRTNGGYQRSSRSPPECSPSSQNIVTFEPFYPQQPATRQSAHAHTVTQPTSSSQPYQGFYSPSNRPRGATGAIPVQQVGAIQASDSRGIPVDAASLPPFIASTSGPVPSRGPTVNNVRQEHRQRPQSARGNPAQAFMSGFLEGFEVLEAGSRSPAGQQQQQHQQQTMRTQHPTTRPSSATAARSNPNREQEMSDAAFAERLQQEEIRNAMGLGGSRRRRAHSGSAPTRRVAAINPFELFTFGDDFSRPASFSGSSGNALVDLARTQQRVRTSGGHGAGGTSAQDFLDPMQVLFQIMNGQLQHNGSGGQLRPLGFISFGPSGHHRGGGDGDMNQLLQRFLQDYEPPSRGTTQDVIEAKSKKETIRHVERLPQALQSCVVCITDFEEGDQARKLKCGHMFHPPCIDRWLKTNKSCPVCKQDIA